MKKYIDTGKIDTRSGFGEGLVIAGRENDKVLALQQENGLLGVTTTYTYERMK